MFQFIIPGMTCGGCAHRVTNAILSVDPTAYVATDPPSRAVRVTTSADEAALIAALAEAGYPAQPMDQARAA